MHIPASAAAISCGATSSAADTGFISSRELDDLYELYMLTQQENDWDIEPRDQFEARYREEVAARDNKVSER